MSTMPAEPGADIAVRLDGVSKRFGDTVALHDASLRVARGPAAGALLLRRTRATRDEIARLADAWFGC